MATATNDKPLRLGDLPVVKTNILENARQYDKGVVGGYSGTFPLTAASQGGIYLLPSTGKFYVCETAYNGAQISAPNSNFVELSVWKNHDRLSNLEEFENLIFTNVNPKTLFKGYRVGNTCTVCISTSGNTSIPAGVIAKVNRIPKIELYFRIMDNTNVIASITFNKNGEFVCEKTTNTSSGSFGGVLTYSI